MPGAFPYCFHVNIPRGKRHHPTIVLCPRPRQPSPSTPTPRPERDAMSLRVCLFVVVVFFFFRRSDGGESKRDAREYVSDVLILGK